MKKLLNKDNVLPAVLLAFVSWLGVNAVGSNVAIASLQTSQQEDERVNKLVYALGDTIPKINAKLDSIQSSVDQTMTLTQTLSREQKDINLRMFCNSLFNDRSSVGYEKCVTEIAKAN
tara:strand:- start:303 stop:656 length:354 start_codon:yes stop_codon:yes gene_type:complete